MKYPAIGYGYGNAGSQVVVNRRCYLTRTEARSDIFDYIERFHNPRRRRKMERLESEKKLFFKPSVETGQNPIHAARSWERRMYEIGSN